MCVFYIVFFNRNVICLERVDGDFYGIKEKLNLLIKNIRFSIVDF